MKFYSGFPLMARLSCLFVLFSCCHLSAVCQSEAWAISGSFTKIAVDDKGHLFTVGANVLTKFDTSGNVIWSNSYALPIENVATGSGGNIYLTGTFTSTTQYGTYTLTPKALYNFYISKLSPNGNVQWVKQVGTSASVGSLQLAVDSKGSVYFAGTTSEVNSIFVDGIFAASVGSYQMFFAKFWTDGTFKFLKSGLQLGTTPYESSLNVISIDKEDNIHAFYGSPYIYNPAEPAYNYNNQSRTVFDSSGLLLAQEQDVRGGSRINFRGYKARNSSSDYLSTRIRVGNFNIETTDLNGCLSFQNSCYNSPPINPDYDNLGNVYFAGEFPVNNGSFLCPTPASALRFTCSETSLNKTGLYRNIYVRINDTLVSTQQDSLTDEFPIWLVADPNGKSLYVLASWNCYPGNALFHFGNSILSTPGFMVLRYRIDQLSSLAVNAGEDKKICLGGSTSIGANNICNGGKAPYSYRWWPGVGLNNSSIPNPVATPRSTTEYVVMVTDATGVSVLDTQVVVVDTSLFKPEISIVSGTNPFCEGEKLVIRAGAGVSYLWNDGTTSDTLSVSRAGTYTVTVLNDKGCVGTSDAFIATTKLRPATPTILPNGPASYCFGGVTTLTAQSMEGVAGYLWNTGATTPSITVSLPGNYSVTTTGANGCTSLAAVKTVTVNPLPTGSITAANGTSICRGDSVLLTINSSSAAFYLWNTGETSQNIWVKTANVFFAQLTSKEGCVNTTSNRIATSILPVPIPVISQTGNQLTATPPAAAYQWFMNGTLINGATLQTLTITKGGTYSVTVLDSNGCSGSGSGTAVLRIDNQSIIYQIFPNPANEDVNILYTLPEALRVTIIINELNGQRILVLKDNELQQSGEHHYTIKRTNLRLNSGCYCILIQAGNKRAVQKLLIF